MSVSWGGHNSHNPNSHSDKMFATAILRLNTTMTMYLKDKNRIVFIHLPTVDHYIQTGGAASLMNRVVNTTVSLVSFNLAS